VQRDRSEAVEEGEDSVARWRRVRSSDAMEEGKERRRGGRGAVTQWRRQGAATLWRRQGATARCRMARTQSEVEGVTVRGQLGEFASEGVRP
jgi:hypothetical protein